MFIISNIFIFEYIHKNLSGPFEIRNVLNLKYVKFDTNFPTVYYYM